MADNAHFKQQRGLVVLYCLALGYRQSTRIQQLGGFAGQHACNRLPAATCLVALASEDRDINTRSCQLTTPSVTVIRCIQ